MADVVGHGVAAALLMAKLSAETRNALYTEPTPADAITRLNERLSQLNIQRFVTMICVVLDPKSHSVAVVNAGHMAPLVRRASSAVEQPGEELAGIPLGITSGISYNQAEFGLAAGETVTLFTDGINESLDGNGASESPEIMNSTAEAIAFTKHAQSVGADATLHVAGYYNRPNQEGLYQHFKAVHDATDIPIILYHSRDDSEIPLSHLRRYQEHLPNATSRVIEGSEHSFVHGLPQLVRDIQAVAAS